MTSKEKILEIIKHIQNKKKKRADLDNICAEAKDISREDIEVILTNLCEENILNLTLRAGRSSYCFVKDVHVINDLDLEIIDEQNVNVEHYDESGSVGKMAESSVQNINIIQSDINRLETDFTDFKYYAMKVYKPIEQIMIGRRIC